MSLYFRPSFVLEDFNMMEFCRAVYTHGLGVFYCYSSYCWASFAFRPSFGWSFGNITKSNTSLQVIVLYKAWSGEFFLLTLMFLKRYAPFYKSSSTTNKFFPLPSKFSFLLTDDNWYRTARIIFYPPLEMNEAEHVY